MKALTALRRWLKSNPSLRIVSGRLDQTDGRMAFDPDGGLERVLTALDYLAAGLHLGLHPKPDGVHG